MTERGRGGPVDRLLGAVPFDALIRQIDIQAILERVDLNALLDEVDVNRLLDRIDVDELVARLDLGEVIAESTRGVAGRVLDAIRAAAAGLDLRLERGVNRILHRAANEEDASPDGAADPSPAEEPRGRNAGPVSRFSAGLIDLGVSWISLSALIAAVVVVIDVLLGSRVTLNVPAGVGIPATTLWLALYFVVSWAVPGRTVGMAILGLLVIRGDGSTLGWRHALLRVLLLPFSLIAGLGLIGVIVGRRHRALHDVIADSHVIFDW